jgi:hypothetical protein
MAHFAQLDKNNLVIQVIVVANENLLEDGIESESKGIAFCQSLLGLDTKWVQTSYNRNIRKNYAGIGYTYDPIADHFFAPKPFPSWVFNDNKAIWESPIACPTDGKKYIWNETVVDWEEIV